MIQNFIKTFLCLLLLLIMFTSPTYANISDFEEDFEEEIINSFPKNWKVSRNIQWQNLNSQCMDGGMPAVWLVKEQQGSKRVGITIDGPGCTTEITPNSFQISDPSNYEVSLDISLPESVYKDRSILIKYNGGDQAYGFTIKDPYKIHFFKAVGADYSQHLGTTIYDKGFEENKIYNIKVKIQTNNIELYVNEEKIYSVADRDPILNIGTIALQASIGSFGKNSVYFDNIKVTDLSPNKTLLEVPHFSQRDTQWKDEEYDHASNFQPVGRREIEDWGCALTAGAMILNYYGYNTSPDGTPTTPSSLNNYLKSHHGYTKNGSVIWNYISKYAKDVKTGNATFSNSPNLELEYSSFNTQTIADGINQRSPPSLK